jgi:hypothetical protein
MLSVTLAVALFPAGTVPRSQDAVPGGAVLHAPEFAAALAIDSSASSETWSVIVTPRASRGPVLVTVRVHRNAAPGTAGPSARIESARSAEDDPNGVPAPEDVCGAWAGACAGPGAATIGDAPGTPLTTGDGAPLFGAAEPTEGSETPELGSVVDGDAPSGTACTAGLLCWGPAGDGDVS